MKVLILTLLAALLQLSEQSCTTVQALARLKELEATTFASATDGYVRRCTAADLSASGSIAADNQLLVFDANTCEPKCKNNVVPFDDCTPNLLNDILSASPALATCGKDVNNIELIPKIRRTGGGAIGSALGTCVASCMPSFFRPATQTTTVAKTTVTIAGGYQVCTANDVAARMSLLGVSAGSTVTTPNLLPTCTSAQNPRFVDSKCFPVFRKGDDAVACKPTGSVRVIVDTADKVLDCARNMSARMIPVCASGETPSLRADGSCYSCVYEKPDTIVPSVCDKDKAIANSRAVSARFCVDGERPLAPPVDGACVFNCIPREPTTSGCDADACRAKVQGWLAVDLAFCPANVKSIVDNCGCPTNCLDSTTKPEDCSEQQRSSAISNFQNLPVCSDETTLRAQAGRCQPTCRPSGAPRCTDDQLRSCNQRVAAGLITRTCDPGERATFGADCCFSCQPPTKPEDTRCTKGDLQSSACPRVACPADWRPLAIDLNSTCCRPCYNSAPECTPSRVFEDDSALDECKVDEKRVLKVRTAASASASTSNRDTSVSAVVSASVAADVKCQWSCRLPKPQPPADTVFRKTVIVTRINDTVSFKALTSLSVDEISRNIVSRISYICDVMRTEAGISADVNSESLAVSMDTVTRDDLKRKCQKFVRYLLAEGGVRVSEVVTTEEEGTFVAKLTVRFAAPKETTKRDADGEDAASLIAISTAGDDPSTTSASADAVVPDPDASDASRAALSSTTLLSLAVSVVAARMLAF